MNGGKAKQKRTALRIEGQRLRNQALTGDSFGAAGEDEVGLKVRSVAVSIHKEVPVGASLEFGDSGVCKSKRSACVDGSTNELGEEERQRAAVRYNDNVVAGVEQELLDSI